MKKENTVVAAMERGFTLVELLVVVAILGILATMAVVNVVGALDSGNETKAVGDVKTFDSAVSQYVISHKKLPTELKDLTTGDSPLIKDKGSLIDPWDNPYKLKIIDARKKTYYVYSFGPDGVEGTEDDIKSNDTSKSAKD